MRSLRCSIVASLLALSACGAAPEDATPTTTTSSGAASAPTTATPTGSAPAGSELLAFTAPAIGGGEVDAAIYQGRPTLLWFWAPW